MPARGGGSMTDLSISVSQRPDSAVVAVAGDVDLSTSPALAHAVATAVDAAGDLMVVVDLSGVRFCDSTGISALVQGRRLAQQHGVRYRVTGATGLVLDVLEITGVWEDLSGTGEPSAPSGREQTRPDQP